MSGAIKINGTTSGSTTIAATATGGALVSSESAAVTPLVVRAASGQSANIIQGQDSDGSGIFAVTPDGNVYAVNAAASNGIVLDPSDASDVNILLGNAAGTAGAKLSHDRATATTTMTHGSNGFVFQDTNGNRWLQIASNGTVVFAPDSADKMTWQMGGDKRLHFTFTGTSTNILQQFANGNGTTGQIVQGSTSTSYQTTSDYRLKENVVPIPDAASRLMSLNPVRFNFVSEPDVVVDGFLAHEAQAVVPECASGAKDAVDENGDPVYQGIDQSKLVPLLVAAVQEQQAQIEALTARLDAAGL